MFAANARAELEQLRASWLLHLRAEHESEKTRLTYRDAADQFIAFLADPPEGLDEELTAGIEDAPPITRARDVRAAHVRLFITYLHASGRKPSTVNNRYRDLQQWFRWMTLEEEIEYSPMSKLSPPQVPDAPVPLVSREEIKAVLRTCKERSFINLRDEAIIRIFCDTGIRLSEMAGQKAVRAIDGEQVPHVDLDQQIIWVLGKGRRWRGISGGGHHGAACAGRRHGRDRGRTGAVRADARVRRLLGGARRRDGA